MKNKILVFDNIIDLNYQEKIKNILTERGTFENYYFPWFFTKDVIEKIHWIEYSSKNLTNSTWATGSSFVSPCG